MLRSFKKPALSLVPPTHTDLFVENYDQLKGWALHFTERDQELAEDLLHDTFIQFTLNRPDLATIENLEGYLYIMMRNLHLSQIRRNGRAPMRSLSVVEFDTADVSFWASDPRDRIRMRDELGAVCQYACLRKETAKAASVLILRFFHGYYPEEIATVVRSNRSAVEKRLKSARAEARTYLSDSNSLAFINSKDRTKTAKASGAFGEDLRLELRSQIFNSRKGECLTTTDLDDLYQAESPEDALDRQTVAHIVSCGACLDAVNSLLGLETLATRYPQDTVGKDPGKKGGDGSGGGTGTGGSGMFDSYQRRLDAHFHHQPDELCVSVNGQVQSFQKVVAGRGELTLIIDTNETLGFVEIFSEQGLRLLMLSVEPPPDGDGKQVAHVDLSNGRTIDANLSFGGPFPSLQVSYNDPSQAVENAINVTDVPNVERIKVPFELAQIQTSFAERMRGWFGPMRVAVATAVLMVAAIGVWFVMQPATEPLVARTVLKQARDVEFALAPTREKVLHRNYRVEEWANGNLKSDQRVDVWQQKAIAARRTYDDSGRMIAGTWTKENGSQQVFEQGVKLRDVYKRDVKEEAGFQPTVNGFANLIDRHGVTSHVAVEQNETHYSFNFEDRKGETEQKGFNERLIAATLVLDRETFNPVSQTLTLQIGNETREYRFSDIVVEQKPTAEVSSLIFFPEAELTRGATTVTKPLQIEEILKATKPEEATAPPPAVAATAALEVEVLERLHNIGADISEQIDVKRTANGRLFVEGLVETDKRKQEILNALAPLRSNPAVTVKVQTIEEATRELERQKVQPKNPTDVSKVRIESNTVAADADLRQYFARSGGDTEENIRRFAGVAVDHSRAALYQASALNRLTNRFSADQIAGLDPAARGKLLGILKGYAATVRRETVALRNQLNPVFGGFEPPGGGGEGITSDADLIRSARRLFELAEANDRTVRSALRLTEGASAAEIRSAAFRRSMTQAESLAAAIERAK
jgi:RNA polymerase sigma factor (sigma-70 family)